MNKHIQPPKTFTGKYIQSSIQIIIDAIRKRYKVDDVSIINNTVFINTEKCDLIINMISFCTFITYQSLGIKDLILCDEVIDKKTLDSKINTAGKILSVLDGIIQMIKDRHQKIEKEIKSIENDLLKSSMANKNPTHYRELKKKLDEEKMQSNKDDVFINSLVRHGSNISRNMPKIEK